jgi:23S rRNA pseudouridine1911/1915/1917 synthase
MSEQIWQVTKTETGARLDKWLAATERLGSRARAFAALERGKIFVNGEEQTAAAAARQVQAGDQVRHWADRPGSTKRRAYAGKRVGDLNLLYEDETLLVVNKPAGLLSVPLPQHAAEASLAELVARHLRGRQPHAVHRLDRDTSGLVLFAKSFAAQQKLKDQFASNQPERVYQAIVYGRLAESSGVWRDELIWDQEELKQRLPEPGEVKTHKAVSRYRVLEQFANAALLEVSLVTGKRNQIRIQAGLRGHPLVGEKMYVYENAPSLKIPFARQALHAQRLSFKHPVDGRRLKFEAPLPGDLQKLLVQLRGKEKAQR